MNYPDSPRKDIWVIINKMTKKESVSAVAKISIYSVVDTVQMYVHYIETSFSYFQIIWEPCIIYESIAIESKIITLQRCVQYMEFHH